MEIIEQLLANGEGITFSALFIGLLLYVMKTNDKRETDYRQTISELTKVLNNFEDLKQDISSIKNKIFGG